MDVGEGDADCVGVRDVELDELVELGSDAEVVVVDVASGVDAEVGVDDAAGVMAAVGVAVELTVDVELDELPSSGEAVRECAVDGAVGSTTTGAD